MDLTFIKNSQCKRLKMTRAYLYLSFCVLICTFLRTIFLVYSLPGSQPCHNSCSVTSSPFLLTLPVGATPVGRMSVFTFPMLPYVDGVICWATSAVGILLVYVFLCTTETLRVISSSINELTHSAIKQNISVYVGLNTSLYIISITAWQLSVGGPPEDSHKNWSTVNSYT